MKFLLSFIVFLCWACSLCQGQLLPENLHFTKIGAAEGLSNQYVAALAQDEQGFIWVGTASGLNRFDGKHVKVYKHDEQNPYSISNNYVEDIALSKKGGLWVTTFGGLNYYDPVTDRFTHWIHDEEDSTSIPTNMIFRVIEDQEGLVWMVTLGRGLIRFEPETGGFTHWTVDNSPIRGNGYNVLMEDSHGRIWFGNSGRGISIFDKGKDKFVHEEPEFAWLSNFKSAWMFALMEDSQGNIWIGEDRLANYNPVTQELTFFDHLENSPPSFSNNGVNSIYEDQQGRIWVGIDKGLLVYHPKLNQFQSWQHNPTQAWSLSTNQTYVDIIQDSQGLLYISTINNLNVLDPASFQFSHTIIPKSDSAPIDNQINTLAFDEEQKLWLGSTGGACIYNQKDQSFETLPKVFEKIPANMSYYHIFNDQRGNLWIGGSSVFIQYTPNRQSLKTWQGTDKDAYGNPLEANRVFNIDADKQGRI